MLVLYMLSLVAYVSCQRSELVAIYPTYDDHPCNRDCTEKQMTCYYKLTLDRFFTMQPDCLNCQRYNQSDCSNPQCIPGDGSRRDVLVFNGMLPGPTISVCHGDTVEVDVVNLAEPQSTTIHWHGMHQRRNSWNDGVPMITQCPIIPGTTWRYYFNATEPGTHFYHSHSTTQRSDGAYGHLIVREKSVPSDKYKYDFDLSEHVISLLDWMKYSSIAVAFRYYRTKVFYTDLQTGILVNGFGPNTTNNAPIKTFLVQKGKSYRFRLIHAGNMVCAMQLSIDGHKLIVISTDGNYIEPIAVDTITIENGERYDFILHANQNMTSYGIRVNGIGTCALQSLAILSYDKNSNNSVVHFETRPSQTGVTIQCPRLINSTDCITYDELTSIEPFDPELEKVSFKYFVSFDVYNAIPARYEGVEAKEQLVFPYINDIAFSAPQVPLLINHKATEFCNQDHKLNCNVTGLCECSHVVRIPSKSVVELIFVNEGKLRSIPHPFHLHGYAFRVIGHVRFANSVSIDTIRELDSKGQLFRNFTNPIIKDSVSVPYGGYTIVRFKADNPGFWFLHCHVDYHAQQGMAMVLAVGPYPKVPRQFPRCGSYVGFMV